MASSNLGIWKIAVDTANLADGHSIAAYLTSSSGTLLDSTSIGGNDSLYVKSASEFAEDTAHASGDYGSFALAVRNDAGGTMVSADGDYSPLQVDSSGRLRVVADFTVNFDYVYAEDTAHASGDLGAYVLTVRQDTLASSTSADGDYASFKTNNLGELYVKDSSANTTLSSILSEIQSITHAEDTAHTSGDAGVMSLAVRNDTGAVLAGTDGDYIPLTTDASGNLRITGTVSISGTFAEDSAHTSGDSGMHSLAVRKDALASNVSADGDYASFIQWSEGSLKTVDMPNISILGTAVTVTDTATALPASALANRRLAIIQNRGSKSIFVGPAGVTSANGLEVPGKSSLEINCGPSVALFGICATGESSATRVTELS
jgi:hypothetical protein